MGTENSITGGSIGSVVQAGTITTLVQAGPASLPRPAVRPAGLPRRGVFVGREELLGALLDALGEPGEPLLVSAIAGLGGIGKTALAVETAHRAADRFPGGVLFVDLHGYDDHPVTAEQALDTLLRALGEDVPPGLPAREHLYRSRLAALDGPLLLIADNASSPAQVTPLLPGDPRHRVLVTSRHRLADRTLTPRHFRVDVLRMAESRTLLTQLTGIDDELLPELAELCGHLPLALRITAALLTDRSPAELAGDLADARERLTELDHGPDLAVRAAFGLSHRRLTPAEARLFALLGLHPGPDLPLPAVSALADLPERDTARLLRALTGAHLLDVADGRYRFHDLVKLYASEQPVDDPEAAVRRLLGHYDARAADIRSSQGASDAWLKSEAANLPAVLLRADELGLADAVPELYAIIVEQTSWITLETMFSCALLAVVIACTEALAIQVAATTHLPQEAGPRSDATLDGILTALESSGTHAGPGPVAVGYQPHLARIATLVVELTEAAKIVTAASAATLLDAVDALLARLFTVQVAAQALDEAPAGSGIHLSFGEVNRRLVEAVDKTALYRLLLAELAVITETRRWEEVFALIDLIAKGATGNR
ncbi:hypothetical protein AB0K51_10405 [Kitasatospora sp. NPDC049285]|uniref:hypothetical protein n=1 Tax=Kitasatospora sp. NPDC049285 TaxID=3157096 RepID=UPI003449D7B9